MIKYSHPIHPTRRLVKRWLDFHGIPIAKLAANLETPAATLDEELNRICASVSLPMFRQMMALSGQTAKELGRELAGMIESMEALN